MEFSFKDVGANDQLGVKKNSVGKPPTIKPPYQNTDQGPTSRCGRERCDRRLLDSDRNYNRFSNLRGRFSPAIRRRAVRGRGYPESAVRQLDYSFAVLLPLMNRVVFRCLIAAGGR